MLILVYKSLHNEALIFVQELLQCRTYTSLKGELILKIYKVRTTNYGLNSFKYLVSKFWYELSKERTASNPLYRTSPSVNRYIITESQ